MSVNDPIVARPQAVADHFGLDVAPCISRTPHTGNYCPYGLAGVVVDHTVVCATCATDDELDDETGPDTGAVFGDDEWDAPATCADCGRVLDVYQLVYAGHQPELHDELTDD